MAWLLLPASSSRIEVSIMSRQAMQVSMNEDIIEYTFILIDLLSESCLLF